jgi:hypothetical protein
MITMKHAILVQYETSIGIFVENRYLPQKFITNEDALSSKIQMVNIIN